MVTIGQEKRMGHRSLYLIVGLILLGIIGAVYYFNSQDYFGKPVYPTPQDAFFEAVARDFDVPELCERISPEAVSVLPFSSRGRQIAFLKSECYHSIVFKYKKPELCSKLVEKKALFLSGKSYSPKACLNDFRNDPTSEDNISYSSPLLAEEIIKQMGYGSEKLESSAIEEYYGGYYLYFVLSKDESLRNGFVFKVKSLQF